MKEDSLSNLCDEKGTGFEAINDLNREAFMPLLLAIEEAIFLHIKKNTSLNDLGLIESLKRLRDNIFSERIDYTILESEIINKIKSILTLNRYSKKDVLLSISKVLNSVKLHRSTEGKKGYVTFISAFFSQFKFKDGGE